MQKLKGGLFLFRSLHFCHDDDNLKGNYSVFQPGPYIYTCCSVNDSYLPKALERVQLIASAGSCDTAARSDPFRATTRVKDMSVKGRLAGWCVHVELLEKTFFRLCKFLWMPSWVGKQQLGKSVNSSLAHELLSWRHTYPKHGGQK